MLTYDSRGRWGAASRRHSTNLEIIFEQWFPFSGYEHSGGPELERYKTKQPQADYGQVQASIYVPIIERG
ncbi:GyrI-like domain-containing protein [Peribacillus sp. FSL E2-0218]|uniref:GyrI-like domain-containing protein n=1 Tax=Peribacillus sp. FSL E2-0218 TaxID=2921364 RepID=UPI0030EF2669